MGAVRAAEAALEVVVDRAIDTHAVRIRQIGIGEFGLVRTIMQGPLQRFGHSAQIDANGFHGDSNGGGEGKPTRQAPSWIN